MENYIDTLRLLNYDLTRNLGLFRRRAGLSFGQRHILHYIDSRSGLSIQELAALLYVDQSTMSRNIKKLELAGLVETYQDETDKRRKLITLSVQGEKLLAEATESINNTISNISEILSANEIETIIDSVRKYSNALIGIH